MVKDKKPYKYLCILSFEAIVMMILVIILIQANPYTISPIPTFHQFYGEVRDINNNTLSNSVRVSSYINYEDRGSVFTDKDSRYGYSPLLFVENGQTGDIIDFFVDYTYSTSYIFEEEAITELFLILNSSGITESVMYNSSHNSNSYDSKYSLSDLRSIMVDGIGSVGVSFVFWVDLLILVILLSVFIFGVYQYRKK